MRRRKFVTALAFAFAAGAGNAVAMGIDAAVLVIPQAQGQLLRYFTPGGGPLDRYTGRPGAWYALLYLPVEPQWPMQLLFWPPQRRHEVRLLALDLPPDEAPTVVHPLPLEAGLGRDGTPVAWVSQFMLPARSTAHAMFVLIEQWRPSGEPPEPLWVQLLMQSAPQRRIVPWWYSYDDRNAHAIPPLSPLTQERRGANVHEVPMFVVPQMPRSGGW